MRGSFSPTMTVFIYIAQNRALKPQIMFEGPAGQRGFISKLIYLRIQQGAKHFKNSLD